MSAESTATLHSTRTASRLFKNATANLMRLGTSWMIVLLVPPFLVRHMGTSMYGTWMLVLQVGAYASLLDGGLQMAISRYVAQLNEDENGEFLKQFLSTTTALLTCFAAAVAIALVLTAAFLGHIFKAIPSALVYQARWALLLVGGSLAITIPSTVLAGYFLGREKNEVNAVAGSLSKIVGAAGSVVAAYQGHGLIQMAAWTGVATLLQIPLFVAAGGLRLVRMLSRASVHLNIARQFTRFCMASVVAQLGTVFISGLDLPVVAAFDFRRAAAYALAVTASNMVMIPHTAILSTLVPSMSRLSARNDPSALADALVRTTRLGFVQLLMIALPFMGALPLLLSLWVGSSYAGQVLPCAEILIAAQVVRLSLSPYGYLGFSAGEQERMLISTGVECVVNLVASVMLASKIGYLGVALGTLLGAVTGVAVHFIISMPRTTSIELRRREVFISGMLAPLKWALIPAAVIGTSVLAPVGIAARVALYVCGLLTLILLSWRGSLEAEDRVVISALVSRFRPRRKMPEASL